MSTKNITVFTEGDSKEKKTWSNVPYFLTNTLEKKGNCVNRVNVNGNIVFRGIFNKGIFNLIRLFYNKNSTFRYNRTSFYAREVNKKMRKAINKYKDTDIFISTSFSYAPSWLKNKKHVMFCDWTYDYYFKYFLKRDPDKMEIREINRQDKQIENCDCIICLFPDVTQYMKKRYKNKNIYYLGNVINSELIDSNESENIIEKKLNSSSIIFIGSEKYLEGAKCLIKAVELIQKERKVSLDIIGIQKEKFDYIPEGVNCHGYLDKNNEKDSELYYKLIKNSKVYVNTNPLWAAFSATVEAMYYYNPIIATPYSSFTETFGENIDFGYYCKKNNANLVSEYIKKILDMDNDKYIEMCKKSNECVKEFTWDSYVDKMLNVIENL